MVLKWVILLAAAAAVKLDQASQQSSVDVRQLLSKLMQGERDGVRSGLMDIAAGGGEARTVRALANLAAAGFEPEEIEKWVLHETSSKPTASLTSWDADVPPAEVIESFQRLLSGLQSSDLNATKQELMVMARRGGQPRIKSTLRALELLGYDVLSVQKWMSSRGEKPKMHSEKMLLQPESDVYRILSGLNHSDRPTVKSLLNELVVKGGPARIQQVLLNINETGVDAKQFQDWISGNLDKAPRPNFAKLSASLKQTQEAPIGRDAPSAVTENKAAGFHLPSHMQIKHAASEVVASLKDGKSSEEETADVESIVQGLETSNKLIVKSLLAEMYRKGGAQRLRQSLQGLRAKGYDVDEVKRWYSSDDKTVAPSRKLLPEMAQEEKKAVVQPNVQFDVKEAGEKRTSEQEQTSQATKTTEQKQTSHATKTSEQKTSRAKMKETSAHIKSAKSLGDEMAGMLNDARNLEQQLLLADKAGIKQTLKEMLKNGGQARIEKSLVGLQSLGYDADEVKKWLADSVKTNPPKATHAAPELTLAEKDVEEIAKGVKNSDKPSVKQLLKTMMDNGGQKRLEAALGKLNGKGYSPASVQRWILATGDESAPKPMAVAPTMPEAALEMKVNPQNYSDATVMIDEHLVLDSLQTSNKAALIDVLKMMMASGGQERVYKAFEFLPRMGFNLEEVRNWLQSADAHAPIPRTLPATGEKAQNKSGADQHKEEVRKQENASKADKKDDMLSLKESLMKSDKGAAKSLLKSFLSLGGERQLESALAAMQKFGYDPTSIQHWLTSEGSAPVPQPKEESQLTLISSAAAPRESHATADAADTLADTHLLADSLDKADKSGMRTALGLMANAGGQERIKKALAGLDKFGYDPNSVTYWLSTYRNDPAPRKVTASTPKASLREMETVPTVQDDLADGVHVMEVKHFQLSVRPAEHESSQAQDQMVPVMRRETVRHLEDVQPSFLEISPMFLRGGRTLEDIEADKEKELTKKDNQIQTLKAQLEEADRHAESLTAIARIHGF